jgi:acetyl-CoA carboxylase biotin carboxyl carrier protein
MDFTFKEVAEILKIIDASQCEEVIVELKGLRLVVRRGRPNSGSSSGQVFPSANPPPASSSAPMQTVAPHAAKGFKRSNAELSVAEGHVAVRAPMVGTFYRRASPQAPPFVETGQRVKKDDPLCLIEVMKLYTTVSAPADGVIELIAAEDAAPIEFDQLLFVIKPDA